MAKRTLGKVLGSADKARRLALSLLFRAALGIERIFPFETLDDLGFAVVSGGKRILSRSRLGGLVRAVTSTAVKKLARATEQLGALRDKTVTLSLDEHAIARFTRKFRIPKGFHTLRNKTMRIEKLAADPTRDDTIKEMAQAMTKPGVACLIVRNDLPESDKAAMIASYEARGYTIKKSADAPYTGNSAPQYGTNLDGKRSFSDLVQEMYMDPGKTKALAGEGTAIHLLVPKQGSSSADDPTLPRGSDRIKIVQWNGRRWEMTVTEQQLDKHHQQARGGLSDEDKKTVSGRLVTNHALTTAEAAGKAREPAGTPLKPDAKKGIKDREDRVKRRIVEATAGSTAALRFSDKNNDKDRKKKRKKNAADADKRRDSERRRAASEE